VWKNEEKQEKYEEKIGKALPEKYKSKHFRPVFITKRLQGYILLLKNHLVLATANAFVTFFEHLWHEIECPAFSFPIVQS
jgi:hypothetical protein